MKKVMFAFLFLAPVLFTFAQQKKDDKNFSQFGIMQFELTGEDREASFSADLQEDVLQAVERMGEDFKVEFSQKQFQIQKVAETESGCKVGIDLLYTPAKVYSPGYAEKRKKAGVPPDFTGFVRVMAVINDWKVITAEGCSLKDMWLYRSMTISNYSERVIDAVDLKIILNNENGGEDKVSFNLTNIGDDDKLQVAVFNF